MDEVSLDKYAALCCSCDCHFCLGSYSHVHFSLMAMIWHRCIPFMVVFEVEVSKCVMVSFLLLREMVGSV
jgi:hypothetical protein